ncbi:hypothetical protein Dimus_031025 [Dionaea muscipula]
MQKMELPKSCKMRQPKVIEKSLSHKLHEARCSQSKPIQSDLHKILHGIDSAEANLHVSQAMTDDQMTRKSSLSDLVGEPKIWSRLSKYDCYLLVVSVHAVPTTESSDGVKPHHPNFHSWKSKSCRSASDSCGDEQLESGVGALVSCETTQQQSFQEGLRQAELSLRKLLLGNLIILPAMSTLNIFLELLNSFPKKSLERCSRKKLLILDINGLLADIVYPAPKGYKADTKIAGRAIFKRPSCSDFLQFCLERFDVGIWSSRSKKIVDRVVEYLLGDMKHHLVFCWDLSHCTESKFRSLENQHKTLVFKELRKIWEKYDPDLPWEKGDYDESNTLLLDDSPYKALLNPLHTAIFPVTYDFKDGETDNSIGRGGNICAYLEELAKAENVQEYVRNHPFGQSAINERSISWSFYKKVIEKQSKVATELDNISSHFLLNSGSVGTAGSRL